MRILIVFGTHHGQAQAIGEYIAARLRMAGHEVELRNARENVTRASFDRADGVIFGSSVQGGKHTPEVVGLVRGFRDQLNEKVSAFFSVSLSRAEDTASGRKAVDDYLKTFIHRTRWKPEQIATFAGALKYRRYNFFMRMIMRMLAKRGGLPVDTSQDYEFTDWHAVEAFADRFSARLTAAQMAAALSVSQTRLREVPAPAR